MTQKKNGLASELLSRLKLLGPEFLERRLNSDNKNSLPDQNISNLIDSEVFKACQPKRVGGFELPFGAQTSAGAEIAKFCGSSGWIVSVLGTHHWMVGKFSPKAQDDIWAKKTNSIVASAFASEDEKVKTLKDGYEVTGKWLYASGIHLCDWVIILCRIPQNNSSPEMRFMIVPVDEIDIMDTWNTIGLRATGSHNIEIKNTFVPKHRTLSHSEINMLDTPGTKDNPKSVYRIPMSGIINYCVAAPALGMAEGALEAFTNDMAPRTSIFSQKIANSQTLQLRTSESSVEIDCARLLYENDILKIRSSVDKTKPLTLNDLAEIKRNASYIGELSKRATSRLSSVMGARGLNEKNLVHLANSDINAACSHVSMVWDNCSLPHGMAKLGVLTEEFLGP